MHRPGLTGSALEPNFSGFGWYAYSPLPADPSDAQLRAAGVVLPSDVLDRRRYESAAVAALGLGLLTTGAVRRRRVSIEVAGSPPPGSVS